MIKRISLIILTILLFVSCTRLSRLSRLEDDLINSNNFDDILALKYLRYSDILKRNHDYISSRYFAGLGLDAYNRKKDFSLTLDDTMKDLDPETLADLYFFFNCWLYFETNNKNLGEATICKDSFVKLTDTIDLADVILKDQNTHNIHTVSFISAHHPKNCHQAQITGTKRLF